MKISFVDKRRNGKQPSQNKELKIVYDNEKGLIFPSFSPIVIFANRHPLPSQERHIVANRILFSVKSRPESFSPRWPRLFFPPLHRTAPPHRRQDLSRTRETLLRDRCQAEEGTSGRKVGKRRGIRQGYVAGDEKAAHVITFPVTTRCREQFILLSIPFLSTLLSPTSLVFLLLVVLGFFKSFVSLFFLQSFVSN